MVAWSSLVGNGCRNLVSSTYRGILHKGVIPKMTGFQTEEQKMTSHARNMFIRDSRWQFRKLRDVAHFYFMVFAGGLVIITTAANIFVGPATLAPIPEGYVPKYWEYYQHPVSRFFARYLHVSPQEGYEKLLHGIFEQDEKVKIATIDDKVRRLIKKRKDYKAYYYRPINANYLRIENERTERYFDTTADVDTKW